MLNSGKISLEDQIEDIKKNICIIEAEKDRYLEYLKKWNIYLENIMWEIDCRLWQLKSVRQINQANLELAIKKIKTN